MAVESLTCPNCGAPVQVKGDESVTVCSFCNSSLRITTDAADHRTAQLDDAAQPQAEDWAHGAVDVEQIKLLLRDGKKIVAIKVYREQSGVGLAEAKAAVESIERRFMIKPVTRRVIVPGVSRRGGLIGCLSILASIFACAGCIGLSSQVVFRAFGPLDIVLEMMRANPRVVEALGEPINPGLFIFGGISSGGVSSHAQFEVPIYGSRNSGYLRAIGTWERSSGWDASVWVDYDRGGEAVSIYMQSVE